MELNREQIVKALDAFHYRILNSKLAEKVTESEIMAVVDALALIRELTDECKKWQSRLEIECDYTKADTVRKMQERLKKRIENSSYNARTDRKTVRKEELLEQVNWVYHEVVPDLIDQIAKEFLEETK